MPVHFGYQSGLSNNIQPYLEWLPSLGLTIKHDTALGILNANWFPLLTLSQRLLSQFFKRKYSFLMAVTNLYKRLGVEQH